ATSDGGATWVAEPVPAGVGLLSRISVVDTTHGWAVGIGLDGKPVLVATADGGATWTGQTVPGEVRELRDVAFLDARRGWAVGALPQGLLKDEPGVVLT